MARLDGDMALSHRGMDARVQAGGFAGSRYLLRFASGARRWTPLYYTVARGIRYCARPVRLRQTVGGSRGPHRKRPWTLSTIQDQRGSYQSEEDRPVWNC